MPELDDELNGYDASSEEKNCCKLNLVLHCLLPNLPSITWENLVRTTWITISYDVDVKIKYLEWTLEVISYQVWYGC